MKKEDKEIFVLTGRQMLLYLADFSVGIFQPFDRGSMYRKTIRSYWKWREFDRKKFSQCLYRLKIKKLINIYQEGKEKYIELTSDGAKVLQKYTFAEIEIETPEIWDQKWRIVIFDIPDDKKAKRNAFRDFLKRIGFIKFQESVFIYPFECKQEINYFCSNYYIKPYVKYIVADFFEDDDKLVGSFIDSGVLSSKMISSFKKPNL